MAMRPPIDWAWFGRAARQGQAGGVNPRQHLRPQHLGQRRVVEQVAAWAAVAFPAPDGARVGVDGLRLQALELEVLEMGLILPVEVGFRCRGRCGGHGGVSSRKIAQSLPRISGSERAD